MAVAVAINSSEGLHYNGKVTWLVALSCIIAASGGLLFGYDTGVTGGVTSMESFLKKFFPGVYIQMKEDTNLSNYCKFDSQLLTSFTSSLYISCLIASFFAASVTRDYGRKPSIIIGGVAFLFGAVLGGIAENIYMLIIGRLLLGVGIGFTNQSVPLYLSEMAPPKSRGAFNCGFQLCIGIGGVVASLTNYGTEKIKGDWGWRISLLMAALPALVLLVGALFLPETPNSLIQQGRDNEKAKRLLEKIRGTDDVQEEFDDLVKASKASKAIKHPFKNILRRKYRPQLVMSIAIPFFQQVTGINVISFYAPILFMTIGSGVSASLMSTLILGIVATSMTIVSSFVVDKLGRRAIFHAGGITMFVTQVLMEGREPRCDERRLQHLGCGLDLHIQLRFCIFMGSVGMYASFFFFGVWVALMTVFVYLLLPETKNIPIEKMDTVWRKHNFWKRFYKENKIQEPLLSSYEQIA
ncbi:Hexose carrier protein HEX6 [Sesamum angolense]|uniref:Hexose carrier protein HEX6 n=1 Tax=Sesamum angolense TaxID=2727404 RepID=A0AAE1W1Q9_9LAMI|nr:Hexose carrier protein HEX6 [Sesamum angolense]